jgi:hypothetical protein
MTINAMENIKLSKSKKVTSHLKFKAMLIVTFDIQDVVMAEWVLRCQTATLIY